MITRLFLNFLSLVSDAFAEKQRYPLDLIFDPTFHGSCALSTPHSVASDVTGVAFPAASLRLSALSF